MITLLSTPDPKDALMLSHFLEERGIPVNVDHYHGTSEFIALGGIQAKILVREEDKEAAEAAMVEYFALVRARTGTGYARERRSRFKWVLIVIALICVVELAMSIGMVGDGTTRLTILIGLAVVFGLVGGLVWWIRRDLERSERPGDPQG